MTDIERWKYEDAIVSLWNLGKSLGQIEKMLKITFTWKNNATGEEIKVEDISRCVRNKLIGFEVAR